MIYAAVTYVGRRSPGELIGDELTGEQAARLLKKGVIRAITEEDGPQEEPAPPEAPEPGEAAAPEEEPEAEAGEPLEIDAADALVTAPKPKKTKARTRK